MSIESNTNQNNTKSYNILEIPYSGHSSMFLPIEKINDCIWKVNNYDNLDKQIEALSDFKLEVVKTSSKSPKKERDFQKNFTPEKTSSQKYQYQFTPTKETKPLDNKPQDWMSSQENTTPIKWEKIFSPEKGKWLDSDPKAFRGLTPTRDNYRGCLEWQGNDGSYYVGEIVDGKRHGYGLWKSKDGYSYKGDWNYDTRHGKGGCIYTDGSTFNGEFCLGKESGHGYWVGDDGSTYNGEWQDGLKNGVGEYKGCDGSIYHGEYINGLQEGLGEAWESNGDHYIGTFKHGLYHGKGEIKQEEGTWYKGGFKDGLKHGKGEYTTKNGGWFKGNFINGKKAFTT